jgi:DNA polymerase-3 subunit delta'
VNRALESIAGQPRAQAILARALDSGRVSHAYAFVGAPGSGRTSAALAFASALLCDRAACGACRACRMVAAGQHPDLHVIAPTPPASNPRGAKMIRIDTVREVERHASLKPVMAPWKVFVLTEADRMTEDAPQAFLKTLEEPPPRTVMILILERARSVPATVLSRCQIVRFEPRPADAPPERATATALLDEVRENGMTAAFARFDRSRPDREEAEAIVDAWWLWCRDLLVAKAGAPAELLSAPDRARELSREAERWSLDAIVGAIAWCREAREGLAVNVAPRLTLEMLLTRLALKVA